MGTVEASGIVSRKAAFRMVDYITEVLAAVLSFGRWAASQVSRMLDLLSNGSSMRWRIRLAFSVQRTEVQVCVQA